MTLTTLFHRRCYASLWQFCMKFFFAGPESGLLSPPALVDGYRDCASSRTCDWRGSWLVPNKGHFG